MTTRRSAIQFAVGLDWLASSGFYQMSPGCLLCRLEITEKWLWLRTNLCARRNCCCCCRNRLLHLSARQKGEETTRMNIRSHFTIDDLKVTPFIAMLKIINAVKMQQSLGGSVIMYNVTQDFFSYKCHTRCPQNRRSRCNERE